MQMLFQRKISEIPFVAWLKTDKENKQCLFTAALIILIQFAAFKFLYPLPNFMPPDSENYVESAWSNDFISMWPIGYSKFLRLVSSITNSHFALVSIQYFFLQGSILYLLFTIRFLLSPGKWLFRILLFANIINPLIPHISNYVSSDALFTALSLLWLTQLFWIIYKPTKSLLILHGLVLLLAFMVRYYSLYYPLISIGAIIVSNLTRRGKAFSLTYMALLLGLFIARTEYEYFKLTGKMQFSAFGGWQIASNALYGYAYSSVDPVETIPEKFRKLHSITNKHMDSLRLLKHRPDEEVAIYYLWDFKSPLRAYMDRYVPVKKGDNELFFKRWASVAPLYASYGKYLILRHPTPFIKHYVWPNLIKYYIPPSKFMGSYNMGNDTVKASIQGWFGWKNNKLSTYFKDATITVTERLSILFSISNLVFIAGIIGVFFVQATQSVSLTSRKVIVVTLFVWFVNMIFSVLSAPIELRYQIFPMVFTFSFACLFLSYIIKATKTKTKSETIKENDDLQTKSIQKSIQLS